DTCSYTTTAGSTICASHLSCQSGTHVCVADTGEGQPCQGPTAGDCKSGLYCEGGTASTAGICRKGKTAGACASSEGQCANGYSCIGTSGAQTCTKWKYPGDTCTPGLRECVVFSWCGSDGKCTDAPVPEGQPCSPSPGEYAQCASGLTCLYGTGSTTPATCQKLKAAGSTCSYDSECAGSGSYCDSKTKVCVACN
ncbi:MAG TPA: hypothetical protein VF518_01180, partial [Polyangia bacterium]